MSDKLLNYAYIRRTIDYGGLDFEKYIENILNGSQSIAGKRGKRDRERFVKNLKEWDKTCNIKFLQYRQKLKELSISNMNDQLDLSVEIASNKTLAKSKNTIIFPTDDDDAFIHNVTNYTNPIFQKRNIDAVYWDSWRYLVVEGKFIRRTTNLHKSFPSNGAALRASVKHLNVNHIGMMRTIQRLPSHKKTHIPKALSLWVRHPGSAFYLLKRKCLPRNINRKLVIPKGLSWATEYLNKIHELTVETFG